MKFWSMLHHTVLRFVDFTSARNSSRLLNLTFTFLFSLQYFNSSAQLIQANQVIPTGSYIVDMGVVPQNVGNALKPYGMIFELLREEHVPILWAINPNKAQDGVDFTYNGNNYRGGPFIIPGDYRSASINAIISNWESQGVVGVTTTSDFIAPIYWSMDWILTWTLDAANGRIAKDYLDKAGIPEAYYNWVNPQDLNCCNDLFIMPHADPVWSSHSNLYNWVIDRNLGGCEGSVWAACHAVSALENAHNPDNPTEQMNFLSLTNAPAPSGGTWADNSLVLWNDHDDGSPSYNYNHFDHPVMQFLGNIDAATENGSEQVYLPQIGGGWRPETYIGVWDPDQSDLGTKSPGEAAIVAFGDAFGVAQNGKVMYEAGHAHNKSTGPENIAAMRAMLNFSFWATATHSIQISTTNTFPSIMNVGVSEELTVSGSGGSGNYTYEWATTCSGTFSNPFSSTTIFTPNAPGTCILEVLVSDACGRESFFSKVIVILDDPQPPVAMDDVITTAECAPGVVDVLSNDNDPEGGNLTVTLLCAGSNGTFINLGTGSVTYIPDNGFIGMDMVDYEICDPTFLCDTATISVTVGLNTAPTANNDNDTTLIDTPVEIDVLANDSDPENGLLNIDIVTPSSDGTAFVIGDQILFQPDAGFSGDATFTYEVCDLGCTPLCDTATVMVNIGCNPIDGQVDIVGNVFLDQNANGNLESGELGQEGIKVYLYEDVNVDSLVDAGDVIIDSTITQGNGSYAFTAIPTFAPPEVLCDTTYAEQLISSTIGNAENALGEVDGLETNRIDKDDNLVVAMGDTISVGDEFFLYGTVNGKADKSDGLDIEASLDNISYTTVENNYNVTNSLPLTHSSDFLYLRIGANDKDSDIDLDAVMAIRDISNPGYECGDNLNVTITSTKATSNYQESNTGYGACRYAYIETDPFYKSYTFVEFDFSSLNIDPECEIQSALLILTQSNDNESEGDDFQFQIRRVTNSWTEGNNGCGGGSNGLSWTLRNGTDTWSTNGGDYAATVYATGSGGADDPEGTTYSMDITTLVNEWIDGTYSNYGLAVVPSTDPNPGINDYDWFSFWSDDASNALKRPKIEITLGCTYTSDYIIEIDTTTLPVGNPYLTTDNVETANFTGLGEVDCGNNFGFDLSNNPPIATDDSDTTEMNVPISVIVLDDDFDIDGDNIDLQATIVSSPSQGGFVYINDNGTPGDLTDDFLNYTPPVNYAGKDTLTYAICDDGAPSLCDTADVIITILALTNDPPVAVDDIAITEQDEMICIDVLSNDSDPEGDNINPPTSAGISDTIQMYSSSGTVGGIADALDSINGSGAVFNSTGDSLILDFGSIVPSGNMVKLETFGLNSQGSIRTIRLEQLSDDQTTVSNALDVSHCCSAAGLATKNTNYILDADTRYLLITMPFREGGRIEVDYVDIIYITGDVNSSSKGGNVTIIPGGIICYTPPSGFTGNDDFDYIICDPSGLCDKGKVVINVTPPTNTPPTLFPDVAQACTNQAEIINVVVNDTDSDGNIDPTSVSIFSTPSNGAAVSNGDGTVTYTSNIAFTGLDTFQYQVCDDGTPLPVECSITSVVVNVSSLNTAPIAFSDTASTILNQVFYINVLENDSDAEGNNLTVTINAAPANGLAVVLGNGLIEYTPNPDYSGPDSLTYNVCDDGCPTQCTNGVLVIIDVENQPPVAIDDYEETGMNTSVDVCVLDNDIEPDGNTILLFSMGQDASDNMTLQGGVLLRNNNVTPIDSSDDKVSYTPPMGYTGLDTFYYRVCDDVNPAACDTAQVIINITPPIDLEVEKTVNAGIPVVGNNYTFKIKVTNNSATDGTGIFIRDNLPNELTYVSDDGGGFYDSNSGIWNVGTLNSGASDSLEITATLNTYFANNIAEVSAADQYDIDSSPDNDDGDQSEDDESAASLQINLPPVADNEDVNTPEETAVIIAITVGDIDPDGMLDSLSIALVDSTSNGEALITPLGNITMTYYEAGHMMYTEKKSLQKFKTDLDAFVELTLSR